MKVYLDDRRETPEGWHRTFSVDETIELLKTQTVTHLSLDNDLGKNVKEGWIVMNWLEDIAHEDDEFPIPECTFHTDNPVRKAYMKQTLEKIFERKEKFLRAQEAYQEKNK